MSEITSKLVRALLAVTFLCALNSSWAATHSYALPSAASPTNNPLKGFIPYSGVYPTFPYSLEYGSIPLRSLMTGPTNFDWTSLDALISSDASRGHQTVFRVYLDYPTQPIGIPQYLLDAGLTTYSYTDYGNTSSVCPDYSNPLLNQAMTNFIAALGARYDGDPRVGFIQLGLLGFWGEWHTYPHNTWFASTAVQDSVMNAYQAAFTKTKLLVRYPMGTNPAARRLGYHDDSFAYQTLGQVSNGSAWYFLGLISAAGDTNKWMTQPIGGEVRPEVQGCMWDASQSNCIPTGQEFTNCVNLTHASWMLNQGVFNSALPGPQQSLALAGAQQMGYALCVSNAILADTWTNSPLNVSISLRNLGVAPFYYDWPVQLGVLSNNWVVSSWTTDWKLSSLVPATTNTLWSWTQANHGLKVGQYTLIMRVQNPLLNGVPFHFANAAQDADKVGWLTLGQFSVVSTPAPPTLSGSLSASTFYLQVNNSAPGSWTVQWSPDCLTWNSLLTTNTSTAQWSVTDTLTQLRRFYRVVRSP